MEEEKWLTLAEATEVLGRSAKTVERLVDAGEVKSRTEPRTGRRPERLYHSGDLERVRFEEEQGTRTPRNAMVAKAPVTALTVADETAQALRELVERFFTDRQSERIDRLAHQEVQRAQFRFWLTLKEASSVSGIPRGALRQLVQEERINARKFGRALRIQRASLEAFNG